MSSQVDPSQVLIAAKPVSKTGLSGLFNTVRTELDHGGYLPARCATASSRTVNDRLLETVSVKDFGAQGTGDTTLRLTAAIVAQKTTLGFTASNSFDDIDGDDTPDYLAFAMAVKYLESVGGGTIQIPPGTYILRRPIPLLSDRIKLQGMGATPDQVRLRNTWDVTGKTGFALTCRGSVVQFGSTHPTAFTEFTYANGVVTTNANVERCTSCSVSAGAIVGQRYVDLSASDATQVIIGRTVWVCDVSAKTMISGADLYKAIRANIVTGVDASTGRVYLKYPIKDAMPAGATKLYLSGTGALSQRGPHRMPREIGIENVTLVSDTKYCMAETGAIDSTIRNVKGESAYGFMATNCLAYCTLENIQARFGIKMGGGTGRNGFEIKGASQSSTFRNIELTCEKTNATNATTADDYPNVAFGENSADCTVQGLTLYSRYTNTGLLLNQTRSIQVRDVNIFMEQGTCGIRIRRADGSGTFGTMAHSVKGLRIYMPGGVQGIELGDSASSSDAIDHLEMDDAEIIGTNANTAIRAFASPKSGWIANIRRGPYVAPTINGLGAGISREAGIYTASLADINSATSWVNTFLFRRNRMIVASDDASLGRTFVYSGSGSTWRPISPQAAAQANSTAADIATLRADFNALLAKLRAAGLLAG